MDMHMMPLGDLKLLASAATVGLSLSALLWWLPRRRSHSHIRLTYLDIKGIAEPIRLAFVCELQLFTCSQVAPIPSQSIFRIQIVFPHWNADFCPAVRQHACLASDEQWTHTWCH